MISLLYLKVKQYEEMVVNNKIIYRGLVIIRGIPIFVDSVHGIKLRN